MASTPQSNRRRPIHGTAEPTDRVEHVQERARAPHDRIEQMADILAPRHERMLTAVTLDDHHLGELPDESAELDDLLVAEIEGLDHCLRRVERARRESIVHSAQFGPKLEPQNDEIFEPGPDHLDSMPGRLGRFEIVRELGRGGLGVVLLAYDPVLKRRVALKIPRAEALITAQLRQRFEREAQAAARLTHPHIVPVHEVGTVGPICFIAAAYVQGQSLSEWLRMAAGPMAPRAAAELVAELAAAMHYAHGQGVLHRDLKPGNILLESCVPPDGSSDTGNAASRPVPKITDFGLAKLMDLAGDETRTGVILGTPAYMSPEQAMGGKLKLGPETDVYSLGAILYELLTGKPPFRGDSDTETLLQVTSCLPVTPRRVEASIPADLEAICLHCLEKRPQQRYQTAAALAADLHHFLAGEPTVVRPLSATKRLFRWAQRRPEYAALAGLGLAALMTIAIGLIFHNRELGAALDLANRNAVLAEDNRQIAVNHENRANEQLYVAQMRLASQMLQDGDVEATKRLMDEFGPGRDLSRLRGLEWHVLRSEFDRAYNSDGRQSTRILGHPDKVDTVRFTPDGRWLVTGCQDGHLRIRNATDHLLLWDIPAHQSCVNMVRISRDGRRMVTASCDATIRIWDINSSGPPVPVHHLRHPAKTHRVAFSPDDKQIAVLCEGQPFGSDSCRGTLHVWNAETGERMHSADPTTPSGAWGLEWSPDGRYLVGLWDRLLLAFRTSDWSTHYRKEGLIRNIAFRPDSGELTMLTLNSIQQVDLDTKIEGTLIETLHAIMFGWSADGRFLGTGCPDSMLHVFDSRNAFRRHSFWQHHENRITELAFSPDNAQLATAAFDNRVCVTGLATRFGPQPTLSHPLVFSLDALRQYDGSRVTWLQNGVVRRVELDRVAQPDATDAELALEKDAVMDDSKLLDIPALREPVEFRRMSCGGKRLAWIKEHQVTVADLEAKNLVDLPLELTTSTKQVFVFDHRPIVLLINQDSVVVWDLETKTLIFTESRDSGPIGEIMAELSCDGNRLLITEPAKAIRLVDLPTATCRFVEKDNHWRGTGPTFSPDGRWFAIILNGAHVGVWDTESLERRHLLSPRRRPVLAAFSNDSRTLAFASEDNLTVWNTARGEEMICLNMPAKPARIQFSPDGQSLAWIAENSEKVEIYEWSVVDR
jgi:WD40 repeat protein/tRNA A-37 threonylcarbamoyl transferase component Bud32